MYKINKRVHKQIDLFFKKSLIYVCMCVSTFYGYTNVRVHKYVSVLTYSLFFSFVCYALEIYTDFFRTFSEDYLENKYKICGYMQSYK